MIILYFIQGEKLSLTFFPKYFFKSPNASCHFLKILGQSVNNIHSVIGFLLKLKCTKIQHGLLCSKRKHFPPHMSKSVPMNKVVIAVKYKVFIAVKFSITYRSLES